MKCQVDENHIEYIKVYILAAAMLGQVGKVNDCLGRLRTMLGIGSDDNQERTKWMTDPENAKKTVELLKTWKPEIVIG